MSLFRTKRKKQPKLGDAGVAVVSDAGEFTAGYLASEPGDPEEGESVTIRYTLRWSGDDGDDYWKIDRTFDVEVTVRAGKMWETVTHRIEPGEYVRKSATLPYVRSPDTLDGAGVPLLDGRDAYRGRIEAEPIPPTAGPPEPIIETE
jgi:hypothetical protein